MNFHIFSQSPEFAFEMNFHIFSQSPEFAFEFVARDRWEMRNWIWTCMKEFEQWGT